MTFSYDTERERKYAKPVYKGTGDGLGGEEGEYDVVVIGSGMGGLACGAMCAKYGESSIVLESHIKMGGSAHSFTHGHDGGKYSFEVGPSIFEGLDKPSLNPLRILLDILDSELPVRPTRVWRIGCHLEFRRHGAGAVVAVPARDPEAPGVL